MRTKLRPARSSISDDEIRSLFQHHSCRVPLHAVRMRFLGSNAALGLSVALLDTAKALWGGEFPHFESLDGVNELLQLLIMGLWIGLLVIRKGVRHSGCSAQTWP